MNEITVAALLRKVDELEGMLARVKEEIKHEEVKCEPVRNGTVFKKIVGRIGGQYQVVVACDGHANNPSSEACLINEYFNSFTGHMHLVKNCRDIQPDELAGMMSCHPEWFERVVEEKK